MKDFAKKFYKGKAWQRVRDYCIRRDAYLCQDCLKKHIYKPADEVHHIVELSPENIDDPDISLNPDNLVSLCKECHQARHHEHQRRYKVDEFGRVTTIDD